MAALSQISIGPSPFGPFLYASVGEDKAGIELTVLSALARLGLDPWKEAARLADLPRAAAVQALAKSIALLPLGNWREADSPEIAARLVDHLPAAGTPLVAAAPNEGVAQKSLTQLATALKLPALSLPRFRAMFWLGLAVAAIGWFYVLNTYESALPFEPPTKTTQQ
jgi:hypothetical protein